MTDNEKRAHDLALSYYKNVLDMTIDEAARNAAESGESNTSVNVDIYRTYKQLYDLFLESFNRDYPAGKRIH